MSGEKMSKKVIWQILLAECAACPELLPMIGVAMPKLCHAAVGGLAQIHLFLAHAACSRRRSDTSRTKLDLLHAPNSGIKLRVQ
jgi:hypothetical protein